MHLATNSFEIGNRFLNKEKSNNIDLGLTFQGDKWDYRLGGYHYDFDNYVFLQTLSQYKQGLRGMRHDKDLKPHAMNKQRRNFMDLMPTSVIRLMMYIMWRYLVIIFVASSPICLTKGQNRCVWQPSSHQTARQSYAKTATKTPWHEINRQC